VPATSTWRAVVERLELGQLAGVGLDEVGERDHPPPAVHGRHRAPGRAGGERRAGGRHGAIDVRGARLGQRGDDRAGRRVEALEGPPVGGGLPLATDDQAVLAADEGAGGVGQLVGKRADGHGSRTIFRASRRSYSA
jgi:hypothetical protein